MTVTRFTAYWYENDEYDQWLESESFDDLDDAKGAAFKNASKHGTHLYCEVIEHQLGAHGWDEVQTWVNHHDFGNRWSGWITEEKYKRLYA